MRQTWIELRKTVDWHIASLRASNSGPTLDAQCLLVSGEDHRHGFHPGFDSIAIVRAAWSTLALGKPQGGSTIEQQIVRVLTGRYDRTLARKVAEIWLAVRLACYLEKAVTPALYLAIGYYGWKMCGYWEACHRLGFDPAALTLRRAALLVARLKYPEPRIASGHRAIQIQRRADHLLHLYDRHREGLVYEHLSPWIQDRSMPSDGPSVVPAS